MCNLYAMESASSAIRAAAAAMTDRTGNLPAMPSIYPDYAAPIVRNGPNGRELVMARWGMPSPAFALKGHKVDRGVTNIRNTESPHWRRWLGPAHRCLVPFTAFAENGLLPDGRIQPVWFAAAESRPLRFFAGLWTSWTSVRKVREGEITTDLFGFLTIEANAVVAPVHPTSMPVILETADEIALWLEGDWEAASVLQRPLDPDHLMSLQAGSAL